MKSVYNNENNPGIQRAYEIIQLCGAITQIENQEIEDQFQNSFVFTEIKKQNEVYLRDSVSANLLEIVKELKDAGIEWKGCDIITVNTISDYNMRRKLFNDWQKLINLANPMNQDINSTVNHPEYYADFILNGNIITNKSTPISNWRIRKRTIASKQQLLNIKEMLKYLIDRLDEKDIETIFQILIHFVPEDALVSTDSEWIERVKDYNERNTFK